MNIFEGLSQKELDIIRYFGEYTNRVPGELLFSDGDAAYSLFIVESGKVELFKRTEAGDQSLVVFGEGAVVGLAGIILSQRFVNARVVEEATLFELPYEPMQYFKRKEPDVAIKLWQNVMKYAAEIVRLRDSPTFHPGMFTDKVLDLDQNFDFNDAVMEIQNRLPKGVLGTFGGKHKLKEDKFLFKENDKANAYYFIHEGTLNVIVNDEDKTERQVTQLHAPTVVGEIGFFGGTRRNAGIQAATDVSYTKVSKSFYNDLKKKDIKEAMRLLIYSCKISIYMLLKQMLGPKI